MQKGILKRRHWPLFLALITNVVLNCIAVFVLKFSAMSVALSTSIAAFINMAFLFHYLDVKIKPSLWLSFLRVVVLNLVVAVFVALIAVFILQDPSLSLLKGSINVDFSRNIVMQIKSFSLLFASFLIIFFSLSHLFKVHEVLDLFSSKVSS